MNEKIIVSPEQAKQENNDKKNEGKDKNGEKEWIEYMLGLKYDWKNEMPEDKEMDSEEKHKIRKKWFTCVNLAFDWVMKANAKKIINISAELFQEMENYQDVFMKSMAARKYESNGKEDMDRAGELLNKVLAELILNQKM